MPKLDLATVTTLGALLVAALNDKIDPNAALGPLCVAGAVYGTTLLVHPPLYISLDKGTNDETSRRLVRFLTGPIIALTVASFFAMNSDIPISTAILRGSFACMLILFGLLLHRAFKLAFTPLLLLNSTVTIAFLLALLTASPSILTSPVTSNDSSAS